MTFIAVETPSPNATLNDSSSPANAWNATVSGAAPDVGGAENADGGTSEIKSWSHRPPLWVPAGHTRYHAVHASVPPPPTTTLTPVCALPKVLETVNVGRNVTARAYA